MAEIAAEDSEYRRQLVDLAATRGLVYRVALGRLHSLEKSKLTESEAVAHLQLDQDRFATTKRKHLADTQRRKQAELASSVASGTRTRAQAKEEYVAWLGARDTTLTLVGVAGGEPARVQLQLDEPQPEKEEKMTSKGVPKSGKGTEQDRLSMSPQSIRRGGADPTDVDPSPVQTNTGQFNYDENTVKPSGTDPWATGAGERSTT